MRDLDGNALVPGQHEQFLPVDPNGGCIEAPMTGVQFAPYATDVGTPDENFGATVDGNYGFGDGCFNGTLNDTDPANPVCTGGTFDALPGGDYLVEVDLAHPNNLDKFGRQIYQVTREDDINIGNGDNFVPAVPPPACAGPLHTVHVTNPTFLDIGGSPYEGQQKPLCDTKLVSLANGKSIAPAFNVFTDVPLPGRHWFIIIDDLNFSSNPKSITYGEKAGMPFVPVGIYDYSERLVTTVESDYNGLADVLLPSTNRIACPTPSGVCTNLYRYVGNDPGVPGRLNLNFNPNFRTISAEFEVMPGSLIPADLAPTQVGVNVQLPGGQVTSPVQCALDAATPQLYRVNAPFIAGPTGTATSSFTISGAGFGAAQGTGRVTLSDANTSTVLPIVSWSDTAIVVQVNSATPVGPRQLKVTSGNGQSTVNGLTFHVTGGAGTGAYAPRIFQVGPGLSGADTFVPQERLPAAADHAIQDALNDAATYVDGAASRTALVVVYPNNPSVNPRQNPRGAYYENLIISARVKLQGVGPGSPDGSVRGSIIDGGAFAGDSPVATDWYATIGGLTWAGDQTIYDGAVISLFLPSSGNGVFPSSYLANTAPSIDGFDLRGGDQQGIPGTLNVGGAVLEPGVAGTGPLTTQGGAIFANAYARNLQITNNVVQNNGGAYGTIRIGTPDLPASTPNHNERVVIAYNRVINNAGTNLAGGIGLFNGSDFYQVKNNDICGNFSAEYGGGLSALGYSPGGTISANRVYFNRSYDEGGGIMIAGSLPAVATSLSPGSGAVDIVGNLIQANLANDDGGGVRFLMAGNYPMNVYNNFIVNNISTHEGGGISLNDAPNVRVYNNTIMKNITTATAITSDGSPAPAGLSTSRNSTMLQATLPGGVAGCGTGANAPCFSNPLLFNNIFWDNRAGTRTAAMVTGVGDSPLNLSLCTALPNCDHWDLGVADMLTTNLSPTDSIIQQTVAQHTFTDVTTGATANLHADPAITTAYDVGVTFNAWRNNPAFLGAIMISADLPPNLQGDYHLAAGSPAINLGSSSKSGVSAPTTDIDNQTRSNNPDSGADERVAAAAAIASVAPASLAFGSVSVGSTSTTQTLTLTNTGNANLTGINVVVTAPFSRPAGASGGTCGATLNSNAGANATCTITVAFTPTAAGAATGTVTVTANVSVTGSPVSLTGTGVATPARPALTVLDTFNRTDANNLGGNWSQANTGANVDLRVNGNQALANQTNDGGQAIWNPTTFGANQGAAMTLTGSNNAARNNSALILKANGGTTTAPANFVRVRYQTNNGGQVNVATTTNSGGNYTTRATFTSGAFASGDILTATVSSTGLVSVWKTSGATTTFLGSIQLPTTGANAWTTGTGRIGIQLQSTSTNTKAIDNFAGGTLP